MKMKINDFVKALVFDSSSLVKLGTGVALLETYNVATTPDTYSGMLRKRFSAIDKSTRGASGDVGERNGKEMQGHTSMDLAMAVHRGQIEISKKLDLILIKLEVIEKKIDKLLERGQASGYRRW